MKEKRNRRAQAGFTMVELMAVLIILGLLFTVVVGNFVGHTDKARVITTKASLKVPAQRRQSVQDGYRPIPDRG